MSDDPIERSGSGDPIYRHKDRDRGFTIPETFGTHLEAIQNHLAEHLAPVENVFHEIISDLVHLDVLLIPAADDRPFHVLVTSGMSDLPMSVPDGLEDFQRAELLVVLPPDWPLDEERFKDHRVFWPIEWLKMLGRLPHEYETWLGYGHSVPNGDPPEPIPGTEFVGVALNYIDWLPDEFTRLEINSETGIIFYQIVPLYREEMDLKMASGMEALEALFEKHEIGFVLDCKRPNVAKKKRRFGLF